jgi:hypothetical protein
MTRVKILLVTMFVLSLFLMCGGCESEEHGRRDEWRDQQSERDRSDRNWDRNSESREERHEERH